eukprot:SAG22_NODE_4082_length_1392_cov_17.924981_2_plen_228_part_00
MCTLVLCHISEPTTTLQPLQVCGVRPTSSGPGAWQVASMATFVKRTAAASVTITPVCQPKISRSEKCTSCVAVMRNTGPLCVTPSFGKSPGPGPATVDVGAIRRWPAAGAAASGERNRPGALPDNDGGLQVPRVRARREEDGPGADLRRVHGHADGGRDIRFCPRRRGSGARVGPRNAGSLMDSRPVADAAASSGGHSGCPPAASVRSDPGAGGPADASCPWPCPRQ